MRLTAPVLTLAGTVAGVAAAVIAFQSGAGGAETTSTSNVSPTPTASTDPQPETRTKFLPCAKGTQLRKGECVRVKKKVVVVMDAAPAASQARLSGPAPAPATTGYDDDAEQERGSRTEAADHDDDARPGSGEHSREDDDAHEVDHEDSEDHEDEAEHEDDREDREDRAEDAAEHEDED